MRATKEQLQAEKTFWLARIEREQPEPPLALYAALGEVSFQLSLVESEETA